MTQTMAYDTFRLLNVFFTDQDRKRSATYETDGLQRTSL
jgi:hypothetical protein